jgi:hypothetical protein
MRSGLCLRCLPEGFHQLTCGWRRRFIQLLLYDARQFLILSQHGRGLPVCGIEAHQVAVRLFHQRIQSQSAASCLDGALQVSRLLIGTHQHLEGIAMTLRQPVSFGLKGFHIESRQEFAVIETDGYVQQLDSLGTVRGVGCGLEGLFELEDIRGEESGVQLDCVACSEKAIRLVRQMRLQLAAERIERLA